LGSASVYAYYYTNFFEDLKQIFTNNENPPSLKIGSELFKGEAGSGDASKIYYTFEDTVYTDPQDATTELRDLKSGINYVYSPTAVTIAEIIGYIRPTQGNKILIAHWNPVVTTEHPNLGFNLYPEGPYTDTNTITNPDEYTIPAYYGFIILSRDNTKIWRIRSADVSLMDADTASTTGGYADLLESMKDIDGWILAPIKTNVNLKTFFAGVKGRLQLVATLKDYETFNDSSSNFDVSSLSKSIIWVKLGDTACSEQGKHFEYGGCVKCDAGKFYDEMDCSYCPDGKIPNPVGDGCIACPEGQSVAADKISCYSTSVCGDGVFDATTGEQCDFGANHNNGLDRSNTMTTYQEFTQPGIGEPRKPAYMCTSVCQLDITQVSPPEAMVNGECGYAGAIGTPSLPVNAPDIVQDSYEGTAHYETALCNFGIPSPPVPAFFGPKGLNAGASWRCVGTDGGSDSDQCNASRSACPNGTKWDPDTSSCKSPVSYECGGTGVPSANSPHVIFSSNKPTQAGATWYYSFNPSSKDTVTGEWKLAYTTPESLEACMWTCDGLGMRGVLENGTYQCLCPSNKEWDPVKKVCDFI